MYGCKQMIITEDMATQKPRVSIVLEQDMVDALDRVAAKYDRSRSYMIVQAIKKLLESEDEKPE